jgi:hypothetical protein
MGNTLYVELQNVTTYTIQLCDHQIVKGSAHNINTDVIPPRMTKAVPLFTCEEKPTVTSLIGTDSPNDYRFSGTFLYQMLPSKALNIINKIYLFEIKCLIHQSNPMHNVFKLIPITSGTSEIEFPFQFIEPNPEDTLTTMCIFEISDPQAEEQELVTATSSSLRIQELEPSANNTT